MSKLLLQKEYENLLEKYEEKKENIAEYAKVLKETGGYQNFETRLAWDIIRRLVGTEKLCEWYDVYQCNDSHIETLAKKTLKAVYSCA